MAPAHSKPRLLPHGDDKKQRRMDTRNVICSPPVWECAPAAAPEDSGNSTDNDRKRRELLAEAKSSKKHKLIPSEDINVKRKGFFAENNNFKHHKEGGAKDKVEEANPDLFNVTLACLAYMDVSEDEEGDGAAQLKRKASSDAEVCGSKRKASQYAEVVLCDDELWVEEAM